MSGRIAFPSRTTTNRRSNSASARLGRNRSARRRSASNATLEVLFPKSKFGEYRYFFARAFPQSYGRSRSIRPIYQACRRTTDDPFFMFHRLLLHLQACPDVKARLQVCTTTLILFDQHKLAYRRGEIFVWLDLMKDSGHVTFQRRWEES